MIRKFALAAIAALAIAAPAQAQFVMYPGWTKTLPNGSTLTDTSAGVFSFSNGGANSFTVSATGSGFASFNGSVGAASSASLGFVNRSIFTAPADGQLKCTNNAATAACSVIGTATNDNAVAGGIGEYICAQVQSGGSPSGCASNSSTPVSLTTATPGNITSISLTAGDWTVCGNILFIPAGSTTVAFLRADISSTSGALNGTMDGAEQQLNQTFTTGAGQMVFAGCTRKSLASTTTEYLVAQANFGVSTMTAGGYIWARRER